MGLLDLLLGKTNPVSMFVDSNKHAIHGAAAGFGRGTNFGDGLAYAAQGANAGSPADDALAASEADKTQRQDQINQTMKFLQVKFPDLAEAVTAGLPIGDAWNEAFKRSAPGYGGKGADGFSLSPGETRYGPDGKVIASAPSADKPPSLPTSFQEFQLAQDNPAYAKTLASSSSKPPTDQDVKMQKLDVVVAPDIALLSQPTANGKTVYDSLADTGNQAWNGLDIMGNKPLYGMTSPDFQKAQSALTNIAQSYLYAVSGQSAPDNEVKKIVDSVTPRPFEAPEAVAEKKRRLQSYVDAIKLSKYDAAGLLKGQSQSAAPAAGIDDLLTKYGVN